MTHQHRLTLRHLTRRRFLTHAAGAAGITIATTASGGRVVAQDASQISEYGESPEFAALVEAGELPPVAERLPANPMVIEPVERIGQYGGTWRTAMVGGQDNSWMKRTIGYEQLTRWDPEWQEVIPNIAESFEASADAREFTFTLREGMKWSDGEPFTADDILFFHDAVYMNPELTTSQGSNPQHVEKVDDYTFKVSFEQPYGMFIEYLAGGVGSPDPREWTKYPRHYMEQFHPDFNTESLDQLIEENGAADWVELFGLKGGGIPGTPYDARWQNPELPTLLGWRIVEPYEGGGNRIVAERNPYYWKVDPEGNQLPYIDQVIYDILEDTEVLLLRASNGEIDIHARHINTNVNKPVLSEFQETGDYGFFDIVPSAMNTVSIALNLTHKDPELREIFQNKDFRIGLSHAIDRQEIIDAVFVGQGEPWQLAPRRDTPFFNETLAKQYTEFDIDLANEHLDRVLPEKDDAGYRLRPNGERLTFVAECSTAETNHVDAMTLVMDYWQSVGIDASLNPVDRSLLYSRKGANEHDCAIWGGGAGLQDAIADPRWYFPYSDESNYAEAWYVWYSQPSNPQTEAEEPPEAARQQMELYDEIQQSPDESTRLDLFAELLEITQEQFYAIGISLPGNGYGIVKNNVVNVPASMPGASIYPQPAPTYPQQYFLSDAGADGE